MNPLPSTAIQTGLEIPQTAHIPLLPVIPHSSFSNLLHKSPDIRIRTVIVHNLYLHPLRARVLRKDTQQGFPQIITAIVSRYHHRE